jgi:hypothetical protein
MDFKHMHALEQLTMFRRHEPVKIGLMPNIDANDVADNVGPAVGELIC